MKRFLPLLVLVFIGCQQKESSIGDHPDSKGPLHDSTNLSQHFVHDQHNSVTISESNSDRTKNIIKGVEGFEVLGWFPNWEDSLAQRIDYDELSTIAYFAYVIDPATGKAKSQYNWGQTGMLEQAEKHGNKVLLTAANFGATANQLFLENDSVQQVFFAELNNWISDKYVQGVCLDFEGMQLAQKEQFVQFVSKLRKELGSIKEIYITTPVVDWYKSFDFNSLTPIIDRYVIMGYGFYGGSSTTAGPTDLLYSGEVWEHYNLANSVEYYLGNNVPPSKLMLALPYYGNVWHTSESTMGAKGTFVGTKTFDYIDRQTKGAQIHYDSTSANVWCAIENPEGGYTQYYFDDERSINTKVNFMKSKNLAGMGIWALGYWTERNQLKQ